MTRSADAPRFLTTASKLTDAGIRSIKSAYMRPALRHVTADRYLLPLREGGSLPGLIEANDLGTYVVKFRGAGQGPKALVAEVIAGELARVLGLPVPELVIVDLDATMAISEPDQEVQDLLRASPGLNLGMDYLPGSLGLERPEGIIGPELAAQIIWFDALVQNVDRSWHNPNLLSWHGKPFLIDHGAALYFHHNWSSARLAARRPYPKAAEHVLLSVAAPLPPVQEQLASRVTAESLRAVTELVPDQWLQGDDAFATVQLARQAYVDVLLARVADPGSWLDAVEVARAEHV